MEILRRTYDSPPTKHEIKSWINQPPRLVLVDLSKKCNLWCELHCGYPGQQLRREEKEAKGEPTEPLYTDAQTLKAAFGEISNTWDPKPTLQISADGEPLLHPQAKDAITYPARELGFDVGLTTNGTLLNEKMARALIDGGVKLINISLDAANEDSYAIVRPERHHRFNLFNTVVKNIGDAVRIRNEMADIRQIATKFMITMIIRREVEHEQDAFVGLGKKLGVDKVSFRPLNTSAGLTPIKEPFENNVIYNKDGVVTHAYGLDRYPCLFPFTRFSLTGAGKDALKFVFCPHAWDRNDADVGIYPKDGSLKDLWEEVLLKHVRKAHLTGTFSPHSICGPCADWRMVGGRDTITYANIVSAKLSR